MCQQGIPAVQLMRHRIFLMGPKLHLRVHARKWQMAAIIFTGTDGVEPVIVHPAQAFPPCRIFENPLLKGFLDGLLLLPGQHGFLFVQDSFFLPVLFDHIKYLHILQVQGLFQDRIGIHPSRSVSRRHQDIMIAVRILAADIPLPTHGRILDINGSP